MAQGQLVAKGYSEDPKQARDLTTLELVISNLSYQLDRYAGITYNYEQVTDKLIPSPKAPGGTKESAPDPTGHLNTLGKIVERLSWLNAENENLISVFNNHI